MGNISSWTTFLQDRHPRNLQTSFKKSRKGFARSGMEKSAVGGYQGSIDVIRLYNVFTPVGKCQRSTGADKCVRSLFAPYGTSPPLAGQILRQAKMPAREEPTKR